MILSKSIGRSTFIAAFGGNDYDGVILKIEQDVQYNNVNLIADGWEEHQNFHDCLELQHTGITPGIYRVKVTVALCGLEMIDRGGPFLNAVHPEFIPVSWPECIPLFDSNTDTGS